MNKKDIVLGISVALIFCGVSIKAAGSSIQDNAPAFISAIRAFNERFPTRGSEGFWLSERFRKDYFPSMSRALVSLALAETQIELEQVQRELFENDPQAFLERYPDLYNRLIMGMDKTLQKKDKELIGKLAVASVLLEEADEMIYRNNYTPTERMSSITSQNLPSVAQEGQKVNGWYGGGSWKPYAAFIAAALGGSYGAYSLYNRLTH